MEQHYANIDSQNKELRDHLTSLQAKLAEAEARGAGLQQRLEEASNTIFRLRPQRQECTESEIEEGYRKLTMLVKNWIAVNCESFPGDELRRLDTTGNYKFGPEAEELVLVALVMRYLFTRILNQSFSVLLGDYERDFLTTIQNSMENMELQKGKFVVPET